MENLESPYGAQVSVIHHHTATSPTLAHHAGREHGGVDAA
jgi:hypothetical protein